MISVKVVNTNKTHITRVWRAFEGVVRGITRAGPQSPILSLSLIPLANYDERSKETFELSTYLFIYIWQREAADIVEDIPCIIFGTDLLSTMVHLRD
jgi:hypothetical protein